LFDKQRIKIGLFDPSLGNNAGSESPNLGDLIINEAIIREIYSIFPRANLLRLSTHEPLLRQHIKELRDCSLVFVGGSNLLCSNMYRNKLWKISLAEAMQIRKVILFGVGWWQYEKMPNLYTRLLLKIILAGGFVHSLRDNYTKERLSKLGFKNVINTGCPTMWPLARINFEEIPKKKADNALLMLTDYNQAPEVDKAIAKLLLKNYNKVFFWPQGRNDKSYLSILDLPLIVLDHSLQALNEILSSDISIDYVGTRLHGGIKCLIARKRSLILNIDNRAKEIARDSGLMTIERGNIEFVDHWINSSSNLRIKIDINSIEKWKSQFKGLTISS